MFILNKFFSFVYIKACTKKHQRKFLVCENLTGNKSNSDSDSLYINNETYIAGRKPIAMSCFSNIVQP